ncbi:MAG: HAMP domain-containing sensor histidine kinase [Parvularculaceae bacterium]|nr:HAMP domain-containing sensor histidine kinase [Parvularculaceae bacterium]
MRALARSDRTTSSLLADFAAGMAEAAAVRRAGLEANAARAAAEMSIKARSEFLANMNHELRTPLNAIIGFASMLKDTSTYTLSDEQRGAYADYILQSADLLLGHINTLLEAAALDGGDLALDPTEIDLTSVLADAVKRAKIAADAAKVEFEAKSDGAASVGWGDPIRLSQALDHIIRTAVRFSPEGARILVRASADKDGWAEIAVRDKGPGLTPGEIEQALTAFSEVHRGLDRSFAGPGIGLAIAKSFIELQGGRFSIKSRPGEGTLVRIALPPPGAAAMRMAG